MNNWKQHPENSLVAKYIDCYWLIEKTTDDSSVDYPKLNPDPSGTIILAPDNQRFNYNIKGQVINGEGSHLFMPNSCTIVLDHSKPFIILGIKLKVGALYSLKFNNAYPLVDHIVTSDIFLPPELNVTNIQALLSDKTLQINNICESLDQLLLPWIQNVHEDKHSELVRKIIYALETVPINEINHLLSCSQRTAERAFRRVTGTSMKQYVAMVKFEKLLVYLHQNRESSPKWADIAAQFDFSDQPHLIRYLKEAIGVTPNAYTKQRNLTIDAYGDFS